MEKFLKLFDFKSENAMLLGIERECFLLNREGQIAPISPMVLQRLNGNGRFGYELSACQLEDRVGPCRLDELREALLKNEAEVAKAESDLQFSRSFNEVAPDSMPLDVYPDPTGRYQQIVQKMPKNVLLAACQVIGTHIHVGMPDHETALKVYNRVVASCDELIRLGDYSQGRRLAIYKIVAPECQPLVYRDWQEFHGHALTNGFVENPRNCWHLIRISIHGTIEFRMFGATTNLDQVLAWAEKCHQLCSQAL